MVLNEILLDDLAKSTGFAVDQVFEYFITFILGLSVEILSNTTLFTNANIPNNLRHSR